MWKHRTHLIWVIVHGIGIYEYFDGYHYPHRSNLTIHVLLDALVALKTNYWTLCICKWTIAVERIAGNFLFFRHRSWFESYLELYKLILRFLAEEKMLFLCLKEALKFIC